MKESKYDISIVIPVFNSEECLSELYSRISTALLDRSYELILVNDGSTDKSWQVIAQLAAVHTEVKGIQLSKNFGQNNALLAGLKICSGEYVVIMDDDLQHDPSDILTLINECKKGFDVCFALFDDMKQKGWKNSGSRLNGKVAEWFIGKPEHIYLSPFKAIHCSVIDRIKNYAGSFPYIDVMILQTTSSFVQINVKHHERWKGKGNYTLRKSLFVFLSHLFSYSVFPLKMVTWMGFITVLLSFGLSIYYLVEYFSSGHTVEGWMTITLLLLFFGGMILFALGIIGSYLSRIYQDKNYSEPFAVRERLNH